MHSNFPFKLKHLSDGRTLLCGEDGFPVLVDETGRVRTNKKGQPMTVKTFKPAQGVTERTEPIKPDLQEYEQLIRVLYQPRLNLRSQQIEINGTPISEAQFNALYITALREHGYKFNKEDMKAQLLAIADSDAYDPVKTYLDSLGLEGGPCLSDEEWDQIAVTCFGLEDSWARTVLQRMLISAVARVMVPGCKVDTCLILHGGQGLQKSEFFNSLGGEYFSDSMGNLGQKKDDLMVLHRFWINEWSEADQIFAGAHKSEEIKRFVSSKEDTFRAPYGRTTTTYKRRSILCGTTNHDDWANDPTGNRRFPILAPKETNNEWVTANRDRIWARALVQYRRGQRWWFDKEEEARITDVASQYAATNDEVELGFEWLKSHSNEWVSTRDLMVMALQRDKDQLTQKEVSRFARQMSRVKTRGVLTELRNYVNRQALSSTRIRTKCWCFPSTNE